MVALTELMSMVAFLARTVYIGECNFLAMVAMTELMSMVAFLARTVYIGECNFLPMQYAQHFLLHL